MNNLPSCPMCGSEHTYADRDRGILICPICGHKWPVDPTLASTVGWVERGKSNGQVSGKGNAAENTHRSNAPAWNAS